MMSKEEAIKLKSTGTEKLKTILANPNGNGTLISVLENLGYLPKDFDGKILLPLLKHDNTKVRLLAAKNIAKLNDVANLATLWEAYKSELDTSAKREIVSAIGRLRQPQNKPFLFEILEDNDPKVVCQAIRGLLHYEEDDHVARRLKPLLHHPNEIVRTVIYKQYFAEKASKMSALPHHETYEFLKNIVVNADVLEALE
jgi:hypothetical protein